MIKVVWPDEVVDQIDQIVAYIEIFNPAAANMLGEKLFALGESLRSSPRRGRPALGGTRELVSVKPYMLRYEVAGDIVAIVRIRHSGRRPLA